ncbi:hypothetical protein HS7_15080 [Sulfolobales archaeon HS-7]|nr:hypothetical protein HS7_15080 [Sulfolobales archaeon HS-7]
MVKLSIIILNVGGREYLGRLLNSISNSSFDDYEILIADTEEINVNWDKVIKIKLDHNYGPPRNRNITFEEAKGEYILFLDNDTEVFRDTLQNFITYMDENPDKMVQLKLINTKDLIDSAGGFIDDLGYPTERGRDLKPLEYRRYDRILYGKGAALGMKRETFKKLGGFDGDFFYGFADTDLGYRGWRKGIPVVFHPDSVVRHYEHGSFSSAEREERITFLLESRRLYFVFKNYDTGFLLRRIPFIIYYLIGSMLMDVLRRRKFNLFKIRVKAVSWFLTKIPEIIRKRLNQSKEQYVYTDSELVNLGLILYHKDVIKKLR